MENLSDKSKLNTIETVIKQASEQSIDTQINLPDYCSDIRKILKCFVIPNIFACGISGDRVTADAEALIRVLYVGDENKLECYEQSVPFSRYAELSSVDSDLCACAKAETEYVNCRAASQRRISVGASIKVNFSVTRVTGENIFTCDGQSDIETKSEELSCTEPIAVCNKIFEMSETAALSQSLLPVAAIIKTHTYACIDSIKTIADKMLIKGDMVTDMLYCTDSENGETEKFTHTMPISQIIDLDGIDENSLCDAVIDILSVCVSPKSDGEGKNRLLDISIKAQARVSAYEKKEISIICDGYSTQYEAQSEYKNVFIKNHLFTHKDSKQVRESFDLSSLSATEISDIFILKCDASANEKGGRLTLDGEAPIGILFKNAQGEYGYTEKTIDFSFEYDGKEGTERIIAKPCITVTQAQASVQSPQSVQITLSVDICVPVFEEREKRVCTKLEITDKKKTTQNDCPLTVYFSQGGEKIWDIAKRYNTTCNRIKEDNDITQDEINEEKMLLITAV